MQPCKHLPRTPAPAPAPAPALMLILPLLLLTAPAPAGSDAPASTLGITLPPETVQLRPLDLPGYTVALGKCGICHSVDYIAYQPPGMSQAQWTAEMDKMLHAYGAPISEREIRQLGAYLAVAYGSAKRSDPEVIAASAP